MFLSALAHMHQLVELRLDRIDTVWPALGSAYTALTARSSLQVLTVSECHLPLGVWEHVFHTTTLLPRLRDLYAYDSWL